MRDQITIRGARLHNLKNVTLSIPKNKLVVFTGLSGSGKSSLAFDTLHKEGQRQYMESLGLVTDNLTKPQVDSIEGLSPSISVDQHVTNKSPRSTVGTSTEVFTYLRVLFARLGHRPCPSCGEDVPPSQEANGSDVWDDEAGVSTAAPDDAAGDTYPCPHCGSAVPEIGMANFSFNKPDGACPACTGLGVVTEPDLDKVIDPKRSIAAGGVLGWDAFHVSHYTRVLTNAGRHYGFNFDPDLPIGKMGQVQRDLLLYGAESPKFKRHVPGKTAPTTVGSGRFEGVATNLLRRYTERINDARYREKMEQYLVTQACGACGGSRLKAESRTVTVLGSNIVQMSQLPLDELATWLAGMRPAVSTDEWRVAEPIVTDLRGRVQRLVDVGVGYLTLERSSPTLAGGEAQRLRLASLLGSGLTGVLYVLDEPTIGLHPRDTDRLIATLKKLRDLGNTVLVIEHDLAMLRAADHLVDIGPGAGRHGGTVVGAGTPDEVAAIPESVTGGYLSGRLSVPLPARRRMGNGKRLVVRGARENNLKDITVKLPLGMLVAVTGVSGSGKSSLMLDILGRAAQRRYGGSRDLPGLHDSIEGWEHLDKAVSIDQSAIGRTPRSNAATYTDAFTPIREVFASTPEAKAAGLTSRHFSFNVPGGRCERCEGAGVLSVEMHFMTNVEVRCPACHGRRFRREVLAVRHRGYDVSRVLDLTIEEALPLFANVPAVAERLSLLVDVGLGYLQLGQPATTLSGGEAQRIKLAKELGRRSTGSTLYFLDEPTTGLHPADTAKLLDVLQRLVDAGNSVVVIEHNIDLIRAADWIIDLGPEGGDAGGRLVAEGPPERVAGARESRTGAYLRRA